MPDTTISVEVTKKGQVASETITATIPARNKAELVEKIEKWIDENRFKRSLLQIETPPRPRLDEQSVEDDNARFHIEVHTSPGKDITRFEFNLERFGTDLGE